MAGAKILSTTMFSVFLIGAVDIFTSWYRSFLKRRSVAPHLSQFLIRILFVMLAFIFWRALADEITAAEFQSTHFYFTLFIYCFYRLIASFYPKRNHES